MQSISVVAESVKEMVYFRNVKQKVRVSRGSDNVEACLVDVGDGAVVALSL